MSSCRRSRLAGSLLVLSFACATSAPAPDRHSPDQLVNGPSLHETGRFGVVAPSSGGLRIDEGPIDRPPPPRAATARASGKRKARSHAQRTP